MAGARVAKKLGITVAVAAALAAVAPSGVAAAVTCTFNPPVLDVDMSATGDFPQVGTSAGTIIVTAGGVGPNLCAGGPTLTNVDTITIDQPGAGQNGQVNIALPAGGFGPGATDEPTGVDEIEFDIDLGPQAAAGQDSMGINTTISDPIDHWRFGQLGPGVNGANLNAPESGGPDGDDVALVGVESLSVTIGFIESETNIVDGRGGPEFIGPYTSLLSGNGVDGPDFLAGGMGGNFLGGGAGDDLMLSSPGFDNLDGNGDTDTISYQDATGPVTATISQGFADTGGGGLDSLANFERMTGSPFGDNLTGDASTNFIDGAGGSDSLSLLGGDDTFQALDNTPDTIDCGAGANDSGTADATGVDTVNANCENVNRPPETDVASGPADGGLTNDPTPVFSLTANEPASFAVSVDGGGFQACGSECEVPQLSDGTHQLSFRATDNTALVEQTPVSRSVSVDTAAPETRIDSGPTDGALTQSRSATYGFSSEAGANFECSLDGSAFTACPSPATFDGLATGTHTFDFRAVDVAGNLDPSPARRSLRVDADAPDTSLKKPKVKGAKVKLRFSSDEQGSSFKCRLDKKPFRPCTSPKTYRNLKDGKHKFFVSATDSAGNEDDTAAKAKFEVG